MARLGQKAMYAFTAILLAQALAAIAVRFYCRIVLGKRPPQLFDYIIVVAWLTGLAWVVCTNLTTSIEDSDDPDDVIMWMKLLFSGYYLFELGIYLPKASILSFYWSLFPETSKSLRYALYISLVYFASAFVVTLLTLSLWCRPIARNWSIDDSECALWSADVWDPFYINYAMNISTDLLVFFLPFLILRESHFQTSQKISLIVIFSLGVITIVVSITRFVWVCLELDGNSGSVLCIAELTVAITVTSLPHMKPLLMRWFPRSTKSLPTSEVKMTGSTNGTESRSQEKGNFESRPSIDAEVRSYTSPSL